MKKVTLLTAIVALGAVIALPAQVPSIISYQGRLSAGGTNVFHDLGLFKFALVNGGTNLNRRATAVATVIGGFVPEVRLTDGGWGYVETPKVYITDVTGSNALARATMAGGVVTGLTVVDPGAFFSTTPAVTIEPPPPDFLYVSLWSNDGSSRTGGEPASAVPLPVIQGVFSVSLGDTGLSNMTAVIPPAVFTNADVRLRIWFSDGATGFQQFYPDQRLTASGYAMMAASVSDGAITRAKFAEGAVSGTTSSSTAPGVLPHTHDFTVGGSDGFAARQASLGAANAIGGNNTADVPGTRSKVAPDNVAPPIGSVITWSKSTPGTPVLPSTWVECNGQLLSDPESPYHGQTIPDLNSFGGGTQKLLHGSAAAGATSGNPAHENHPPCRAVWIMRTK